MSDTSVFPHPVYQSTVLEPLFEGVKTHFARSIGEINRAHLVMLYETNILAPEQVLSIAQALQAIDKELNLETCRYTGEYEDYFFMVEHELRDRLGADLGGMLHTARSRNDMDHTVFKLQLLARTDSLLTLAHKLARAIIDKAHAERETPIVAYTHGQPAQPSTFGHYLCASLEVLLSDIKRIADARELSAYCPMGAAAITTSGFPIDRHRMATLLGFVAPKRNSYGCIAAVDYITSLYSSIKLLYLHLGRVIQDMAFWSSFEVNQLYVPNSLVQISSIMPQKRNPVPIEHMRHLASVTVGRCDTIVNTMHNTPFTDMNDSEGEVQSAGFSAFTSAERVLELFTAVIESVTINVEQVQKNSDAACATVTELADTLVREEALSFRQAHEISAHTARAVLAEGQSLSSGYDHFKQWFQELADRPTALDKTTFVDAVSIGRFVECRDRFGGPAPKALDEAIGAYTDQLSVLESEAVDKRMQIAAAKDELNRAFQHLLEL
ncbi:MAG: argininosuccinate lyase [Gammaproteobacteria bacterium]|nr:argininosuccinate lyase [Gammaproteobacteria bacterium]